LAQDDYYYEIQLSNKQLVFYFMAGATGLILSFLAGVMVGRGVDATTAEVQAARVVPVQEERVVAEEAPARPAPPPAEDLTYAQRLEGDKQDEALEKSAPASTTKAAPAARPAAGSAAKPETAKGTAAASAPKAETPKGTTAAPAPAPAGATAPGAAAKPPATPVKPAAVPAAPTTSAKPGAPKPAVAAAGAFTIQVGAFKDKATADSVVSRLKGKGFAAYVVSPGAAEGLFNVRVGSYNSRGDAEHVQVRLRDEEKFKPFIVKN
jgi:DedD protein